MNWSWIKPSAGVRLPVRDMRAEESPALMGYRTAYSMPFASSDRRTPFAWHRPRRERVQVTAIGWAKAHGAMD